MTETMPIHIYIAEKWKPELLGKTPQQRAEVNQLANVITNWKMKLTMPCYTSGDPEEIKKQIATLLPPIADFKLSKGSKFITGDDLSWLDFYFVETLCLAEFVDKDMMTAFPKIAESLLNTLSARAPPTSHFVMCQSSRGEADKMDLIQTEMRSDLFRKIGMSVWGVSSTSVSYCCHLESNCTGA